jgi:hypothetical protein
MCQHFIFKQILLLTPVSTYAIFILEAILMSEEEAKNRIRTYLTECDEQDVMEKCMGLVPSTDRTRRTMLRRLAHTNATKDIYFQMIREGEIHERGTGRQGHPITVHLGCPVPERIDVTKLPFPYMHIDPAAFTKFGIRLVDIYMARGWDVPVDLKREIEKALEEYVPGRPY